jgi:hypothetical protein
MLKVAPLFYNQLAAKVLMIRKVDQVITATTRVREIQFIVIA